MNCPINLPVSAKSIPARGHHRATPVGGERGPLVAVVPLGGSGINDPKVAQGRVSERVIYKLACLLLLIAGQNGRCLQSEVAECLCYRPVSPAEY